MEIINNTYQKALAGVIRYLSERDRTEAEIIKRIEKYLNKTNLTSSQKQEIQEKILTTLGDMNLVDDKAFVEEYIRNVINSSKPKGKRAIENFLCKKGVAKDIIQTVLDKKYTETIETTLALKVAKKKLGDLALTYLTKRKLINHLQSRGFQIYIIYTVVDTITKKD